MSEKYNGWTNYETWLVNVWDILYNDDKLTGDDIGEIVNEHLEFCGFDSGGANLLVDLVGGSLSRLNWRELAEHHNEELG